MDARDPKHREAGFTLRLSAFFALIFAIIGIVQPYLPLWLEDKGLSAGQISLILAFPVIIRVIATPYLAGQAAITGYRRMAIALSVAAIVAAIILAGRNHFLAILLIMALFWASFSPLIPISEAVAMGGVRRAGHDYGRMRLWGSIAFIAANLAGGLWIENWGTAHVVWMVVLLLAGLLVSALCLPADQLHGTQKKGGFTHWTVPRDLMPLILTGAVIQSSHAVYYGFGSLAFADSGISEGWIGPLWAIGVVAEIIFFMVAGRALSRRGAGYLLAMGALGGVFRWGVMSLTLSPGVLVLLQLLHAFTFAATHFAVVRAIGDYGDGARSGGLQAVNFTLTGVAMSLAMLAAGPLYDAFGAGAFLASAVLSLIGLWGAVVVMRSPPKRG